MNKKRSTFQNMMRWLSLAGLALCVVVAVWAYRTGVFTSQQALTSIISRNSLVSALLFILLQIVQVVIPILPGGISCLAGVILFGAMKGFLYNYIGICIGSMLAFALSKSYGRPLLQMLFSQKQLDKYDDLTTDASRYQRLFALAIFSPVAPDDFLCYLAGTTTMSWKSFTTIILLGKPFAIAAYSLLLNSAWKHLLVLAR